MTAQNLLVELLVEELPPKALRRLGTAFADTLAAQLKALGLAPADTQVTPYASPRRLGVHLTQVAARAADQAVRRKLMPVSVGLDAGGQPTPALLKKLGALGLDATAVPTLQRAPDGKTEALFIDSVTPGATLETGLQQALHEALTHLPIPKVMTYQLHHGTPLPGWDSVQFVRPAHGLVALHGSAVVPVTALGLAAGRRTRGHRFEALQDPIEIPHADQYVELLRTRGAVIAAFEARRAAIADQLKAAAAQAGSGLVAIEDEALLDEVTALVERPNVLACRFEPEYLAVPPECLILTMKANQKYFPLLDAQGRLTHQFLVVSNITPADPSAVIAGNERVVRPRLADAKFFFDQDRKRTLESRVAQLADVVYHGRLGSQGERSERVRAIARAIGERLGGAALAQAADTAARLAKADLLTDMVGEFPELQGIMGGYYARHDGLAEEIALAIEDHYKPRFAGDDLPRGNVGTVVALADKLETLVGLFGIGQIPTGDKDPFALRRHALGVIRMLLEQHLPLDLPALIEDAARTFADVPGFDVRPVQDELRERFLPERLAGYLREQDFSAHEIDAVLALHPRRLAQVPRRLDAVRAFAQLPEAEALAAANKRIGNILKKAGDATGTVDPARFMEAAERALWDAMQETVPIADARFEAGEYRASLQALAALRAPVDAFFDGVLVNTDEAALRANRLALLDALHHAMNRVADLARLVI
ncbi:MAG TPA: glycine--tRNA ligase subunit beta [Ottowia sp.]|uniref:glycine--tRNA ligase subunit beta n=1 Tax=Ottowia sp. TaxID=1898956 RepID=UPI002CEC7CE2|nr:glycine--tRNA ligase subunit beta [Ottowia sp.]HMN21739.1 glycine--tRNA ligase subunit beta [Ottowia sp.]